MDIPIPVQSKPVHHKKLNNPPIADSTYRNIGIEIEQYEQDKTEWESNTDVFRVEMPESH